jgi:hypothetical protein
LLAAACNHDRKPGFHAARRVSGMTMKINTRPVAATPASPMKAVLCPS